MSENNLNIPGSESNYLAECICAYILSSCGMSHSLLKISCQLLNDVGKDVNTLSLKCSLHSSLFCPSLIGPDAVINGIDSRQRIQTQMNCFMSRKQKESAVQQVKCSCPSRRTEELIKWWLREKKGREERRAESQSKKNSSYKLWNSLQNSWFLNYILILHEFWFVR